MIYKVELTEIYKKFFEVEAQSEDRAERLIFEKYKSREAVICAEDLRRIEITAKTTGGAK